LLPEAETIATDAPIPSLLDFVPIVRIEIHLFLFRHRCDKGARAVVGSQQNIEIAIMIEVAVDRAASNSGFVKSAPTALDTFLEFLRTKIVKQHRGLLVFDLRLHAPDLFLDMSVRLRMSG